MKKSKPIPNRFQTDSKPIVTWEDEHFALMMKTWRKKLKLSLEEISQISGITENSWRKYESLKATDIPKSKKNLIQWMCTPYGMMHLVSISNIATQRREELLNRSRKMANELQKEIEDWRAKKNVWYWRRWLPKEIDE